MSENTPPPDQSEPATGPVTAPGHSDFATDPVTVPPPPHGGVSASGAVPPPPPGTTLPPAAGVAPPPVHPNDSHRLNKVAAWVGVVAGSVIIVAVIFGTGFFVGKEVGQESRADGGHHMVMRPAGPMLPMHGGFERGPGFPGPFGPGGPMIEIPGQGGQPGQGGSPAAPRP